MSVHGFKTISKSIKKIERDPVEIKIIERFSPEVIKLQTPTEFFEYIQEDLDNYKTITTQKLNKMFDVDGYRVTKIKGEIHLKKSDLKDQNEISDLKDAINDLAEQLEAIKEVLRANHLITLS